MDSGFAPGIKIGAVLTLSREQWEAIENSYTGTRRFTFTTSRDTASKIRQKTLCLILVQPDDDDDIDAIELYIGIIMSKKGAATLDSILSIDEVALADPAAAPPISAVYGHGDSVTHVSKTRSTQMLQQLHESELNRQIIDRLSSFLIDRPAFTDARGLEQNAVNLALKIFGISAIDGASSISLTGDASAATRVRLSEDAIIEHDARWIPGMDLIDSQMTGKSVFTKDGQRLEVYTANKRDLEHLFGVDLIYYNVSRSSIVMVQYKMMEPQDDEPASADWFYRPDGQLDKEIERMQKFGAAQGDTPYRLNNRPFYLKFVKRNAAADSAGIVISLDHFQQLRKLPDATGPRGGIRISYQRLDHHYLQTQTFVDLVRSGYIGSTGSATAAFKELIEETLRTGHALVAAIQSSE